MKKYKKVYIYCESKFPDDGWIQPCFKCYAPTSGQYELDTVKTNTAFYEYTSTYVKIVKKYLKTTMKNMLIFLTVVPSILRNT